MSKPPKQESHQPPAELPESVDSDPYLIRAAGVLVVRGPRQPDGSFAVADVPKRFLLLKRPKWWDLPKGHVDPGETEREAAARELAEETGLAGDDVDWVDGFLWTRRYRVRERWCRAEVCTDGGPEERPKRVQFFLAWCRADREIALTEHIGYDWKRWQPPHRVQAFTVDPLLAAAERWFAGDAAR